jgi:hypothetical protein
MGVLSTEMVKQRLITGTVIVPLTVMGVTHAARVGRSYLRPGIPRVSRTLLGSRARTAARTHRSPARRWVPGARHDRGVQPVLNGRGARRASTADASAGHD